MSKSKVTFFNSKEEGSPSSFDLSPVIIFSKDGKINNKLKGVGLEDFVPNSSYSILYKEGLVSFGEEKVNSKPGSKAKIYPYAVLINKNFDDIKKTIKPLYSSEDVEKATNISKKIERENELEGYKSYELFDGDDVYYGDDVEYSDKEGFVGELDPIDSLDNEDENGVQDEIEKKMKADMVLRSMDYEHFKPEIAPDSEFWDYVEDNFQNQELIEKYATKAFEVSHNFEYLDLIKDIGLVDRLKVSFLLNSKDLQSGKIPNWVTKDIFDKVIYQKGKKGVRLDASLLKKASKKVAQEYVENMIGHGISVDPEITDMLYEEFGFESGENTSVNYIIKSIDDGVDFSNERESSLLSLLKNLDYDDRKLVFDMSKKRGSNLHSVFGGYFGLDKKERGNRVHKLVHSTKREKNKIKNTNRDRLEKSKRDLDKSMNDFFEKEDFYLEFKEKLDNKDFVDTGSDPYETVFNGKSFYEAKADLNRAKEEFEKRKKKHNYLSNSLVSESLIKESEIREMVINELKKFIQNSFK